MDDYSRYITVIPIRNKSDAGKALLDTIIQLEALTGKQVSCNGDISYDEVRSRKCGL